MKIITILMRKNRDRRAILRIVCGETAGYFHKFLKGERSAFWLDEGRRMWIREDDIGERKDGKVRAPVWV